MIQQVELQKGAVLYKKDQDAQHVYVIKKGSLVTDFDDTYTVGETVGLFDCVLRGKYSTTVSASTKSIVDIIPLEELKKMEDGLAWKLTVSTLKKLDERRGMRWT